MQASFIYTFLHTLTNHSQHPHYPHDMVGMAMGQKDMVYLIVADIQCFQIGQHAAASACINHKVFFAIRNGKACGIAFCGNSKACAQYGQLFRHKIRSLLFYTL